MPLKYSGCSSYTALAAFAETSCRPSVAPSTRPCVTIVPTKRLVNLGLPTRVLIMPLDSAFFTPGTLRNIAPAGTSSKAVEIVPCSMEVSAKSASGTSGWLFLRSS